MSLISTLYNKLAFLSPRIEIKLRQIYWYNQAKLAKYNPNKVQSISTEGIVKNIDFNDIITCLKTFGVKDGCLLIVHSSYDELRCTGLTPLEIINELQELVGENGTLAMPVIRHYKEEPPAFEKIGYDFNQLECVYNIKRTPVLSGILPSILMRIPGAEISKHPLNPLCAVGPLAKDMMEHNLDGDFPSSHGEHSCWKFCLDHNALILALGTDLRHHNTMGHVAEESFGDWYWPDKEWYNYRKFAIESKGEESLQITVKERKPEWGMLHQAELNRYKDFLNNGIIQSQKVGSVLLEFEKSQKLISYLRSKNRKGYPYFK